MLSVSTGPLNSHKDIRTPYYDLQSTVEVMARTRSDSDIDGFELQLMEDWNKKSPPQSHSNEKNIANWKKAPDYSVGDVIKAVMPLKESILTVHANKDIGILLCSEDSKEVDIGLHLLHEALSITEGLEAKYCVVHLWDYWKEHFDYPRVCGLIEEISSDKVCVENTPAHYMGKKPHQMLRGFDSITLDVKFAYMFDEIEAYQEHVSRVRNVHLSGQLADGKWGVSQYPETNIGVTLEEIIENLIETWGYQGILTVESVPKDQTWDDTMKGLNKLKQLEGRITIAT
jgi:hypothetical protein